MPELLDLAFPVDEYRQRVAAAQRTMAARGLDGVLFSHRADVCYLTGMETCYMVAYHAAVLRSTGDPLLVTSEFEMLNALASAWCAERVTYPTRVGDPLAATCGLLRDLGLERGRLGLQPASLSAQQHEQIRRHLPAAELVDAGDLLHDIKVTKSPAEVAYLRAAAQLSTRAMEAALARAAVGRTDNDLAAAAWDTMVRGGSEFPCIDPIITVGRRSGIPHSTFRRIPIQPGDAVFLEVGACLRRYSAPLMRTAAAAPVPGPLREAADACRDSLRVLIEHMRPGALARDVAARAAAVWRPQTERLVWHGYYAYSVGLGFPPDWNDTPADITLDSDLVLRPGMCFHATTSLRQPAEYGAAMGETVLVTASGPEVLTGVPRELVVV